MSLNQNSKVAEVIRQRIQRTRFNPIRDLSPQTLSTALDEFHAGRLSRAAMLWDAMERRDDTLQSVTNKRRSAVARQGWEVLTVDDSPEAAGQREALVWFYDHLSATRADDENVRGGMARLVRQMMDAVGKRYAVHEIVWQPDGDKLTAEFRYVPLQFFENREGRLRFIRTEGQYEGEELADHAWLVHTGDGIMEASSVAYLFKHLPLNDWLIYSENNGMPGVKGVTSASPGSEEWEAARDAVERFGAEFKALMSEGTTLEAIDLTAKGQLPYPALVERMDRAIITLWRGSDLSTMSRGDGARGASVQGEETRMIEHDDADSLSETLNSQIDRVVIATLFGADAPALAYVKLNVTSDRDQERELKVMQTLQGMGLSMSQRDLRERFGVPAPDDEEDALPMPAARPVSLPNHVLPNETAPSDDFMENAAEELAAARREDFAEFLEELEQLVSLADDPDEDQMAERAKSVRERLASELVVEGSATAVAYEKILGAALANGLSDPSEEISVERTQS